MIKGFTTKNFKKTGTFRIFDIEVIKNDLLNYIMTIKGERPHMPDFGTRIPLLAFKPIDQITITTISTDLHEAVKVDGRLELIDFAILPDGNGIRVVMDLKAKQDNSPVFKLEFKV